jgi:glycerate dehydrogenase
MGSAPVSANLGWVLPKSLALNSLKIIAALKALGEVQVYGPSTEAEVVARLRGVNILIGNPYDMQMNANLFASSAALKLVVVTITGLDLVDMEAANRAHVQVVNSPDYSTEAVAEQTFALMLAAIRHIPKGDAAVRKGQFAVLPIDNTLVGTELAGKTLGVVGLGRIGTRVAEIARAFGMKVIGWDRKDKNVDGVTQVPLEQLLSQSDVVSLNLALTRETTRILSAARLQLMKPTAVVVNTAPGELIDEEALFSELRDGKIAAAGLDILTAQNASNPLLGLANVVLAPHSAYHSRESRVRCADSVLNTVQAFVQHPRQQ